jgi:SAM-dependent methyltransferase
VVTAVIDEPATEPAAQPDTDIDGAGEAETHASARSSGAEPRSSSAAPQRVGAANRKKVRRGDWRERTATRLGIVPLTREVVSDWLDEALPAHGGAALDAGCGRQSQLKPFRKRIGRFIGVDIHRPSRNLRWLDEFVIADVCRDAAAFPEGSFDVALSSFTVEHFQDPDGAFDTLARWLRPGGWLVLTTVNRRHPFVDAYLSLPDELRSRIQPVVKASEADAHPLVGACNTPAAVRASLTAAGFEDVEVATTGYLWRAWGRFLPGFGLGLLGDLAAQQFAGRRSTIVARARRSAAISD